MRKITLLLILVLSLISCKKNKKTTTVEQQTEKHRPLYHFTPQKNWMNDPNGLIFYEGEYHLFYQYYPEDIIWGPMHWGHAISKDIVHWEHLPIALYPDELGYIFSGSAVFDENNTSGLGTASTPPMVAIFTYHDMDKEKSGKTGYQTQGVAYSTDKGRTWTKYTKNPVIKNPNIKDFRDPKVFWHKTSNQWIMSLAVKNHIRFYSSQNLIDWVLLSKFGENIGLHNGVWECPDLIQLTDSLGNKKWVLLVSINPGGPLGGSATQYFIGDFNGTTFIPDDHHIRLLDYGSDNYAGVTFNNIPESDKRTLFIGWMSNWQYGQVVPTESWRSAMTIPRELSLFKLANNFYVIRSKPAQELQKIISNDAQKTNKKNISIKNKAFFGKITNISSNPFTIEFSNDKQEIYKITFENNTYTSDRSKSGIVDFEENFKKTHTMSLPIKRIKNLQIFVDSASIELFVNDGEAVITEIVFPNSPYNVLNYHGEADEIIIKSIKSPF